MQFSEYATRQDETTSSVKIDPHLHDVYFYQLNLSADWHNQMANDSAARGERTRMKSILGIIKKKYEAMGLPTENLEDAEELLNRREFDRKKFKTLIQVSKMFSTPKSRPDVKPWVSP